MPVLEVRDLTKEFGTLTAVDNANFEIEQGEFVSILGPSGSGKSTILRMIAGFETPTEGSIRLADEDVTHEPPFERDSNMVFQHLALFPHLTVGKNIEYGLKQQGIKKAEREQAVEEMLEMVQLGGYTERDISELSGGEQQRVALARAIVNEPEIVLFDEPLASLDRKLRQHMQFELQRIQEETGITFLYVTHDQEIALSISDRMVILNDGAIEQIGSVKELYDRPQSEFVADFLGDLNTIPVTVTSLSDDRAVFQVGDTEFSYNRLDIQLPSGLKLEENMKVDLCVRPHNVKLSSKGDNYGISGTVKNRMYRGNETAFVIETEWEEFLVIGTEEMASDADIGSEVLLTWEGEDAILYKRQGG